MDSAGRFYASDYYHHAVDIFSSPTVNGYLTQLASEDPLDGPCALALDSTNHLYVNNFHRNVMRFNPSPSFGAGTVIAGAPLDTSQPTGVAVNSATGNVYVDEGTYIAVYDSAGNPVLEGAEPLKIGLGTLGDGYGLAVSQFPATFGRLYVPDASTGTVKVYDPAGDKANPVATIKNPAGGPFISLRDSAIAVDRVTGDVYVADDTQPSYTEEPQSTIYVYGSTNSYKGHLKYNVIDGRPVGLAVDNSVAVTQGRVYVTSGNTDKASIAIYPAAAATVAPPLAPVGSGLVVSGGGTSGALAAPTGDAEAQRAKASPPRPGPVASASAVAQKENLRVAVSGKLAPQGLPRKGTAPISVSVGWRIATTDESEPPKLKTLKIEINRHGQFDYTGLPTCPYPKIQPATTQRALANCRSALVGRGSFSAEIALKGQEGESYDAKGRLLVFNGESHGKPVLFGQIYSAHPFATSFVIIFSVSKIAHGTYGTMLSATLPKALSNWGNLIGIEMKLSRRYGYQGKRHSYISAGCPAPKGFGLASFGLARTGFSFSGGYELSTTVAGTCKVRK